MNLTCRWLLVSIIPLLLIPSVGLAQTGQGSRDAISGAPEGLIHLDVEVTDRDKNPVPGLQAKDFTVVDNGQAEKIVSFHACGEETSVMLMLDLRQLPSALASQERKSVETFLRKNGGHLAQPLTIFMLTDAGLWRVEAPSSDGNALAESIERNRLTIMPVDLSRQFGQNWASKGPKVMELPAEAALKALAAIGVAENRQAGRKLLIWVGPGWGIGSGNNPEEMVKTDRDKQSLFDRIVWFSTLLRQAHITLDTLSAGEVAIELNGFSTVAAGPAPAEFPWNALHPILSPRQLGLVPPGSGVLNLNRKVLALESGGRVMPVGGDLVHQLEDCTRDAGDFYSLSFNPAPAQHFDEYHSLEVHVSQAGLTARTDTFYYDQPYYLDEPDPAVRKVTIAQLDQLLHAARGARDGDLARQLSTLELTERASDNNIAAWKSELHGKKTQEALLALADASVFLKPPASAIPANPPPNIDTQRQMLSMTADYLSQAIPKLPDFVARRTAVRFEETPAFYRGDARFTTPEPLHVVDRFQTTVLYRNGGEVEEKVERRGKAGPRLTTYGTFGPVLNTVKNALAIGVTWSRWETDAHGSLRAVFRFAVPAVKSQFEVGGCCLFEGDGTRGFEGTKGFEEMAAYHGEIAIDPASGALLRVQIEADLAGFVPLDRAAIMVEYGPVTRGGRTYLCPVSSVGLWRARSVNTLTEWDTDGFLTWGPFATKLNDFRYDDYHIFRGEMRILTSFDLPSK